MKNALYIIILIGMCVQLRAQCIDCPNDKGISTNPNAPSNCEVEEAFPGLTNQFLNTFDWAKNSNNQFHSIPLNKNAGWQINDYVNTSNNSFPMDPLFDQGYLSLDPTIHNIDDHDFHWEDGWELLYMNTGYFPNGDAYDTPNQNTNPIVNYQLPLHHQRIPYVILYNRYTSKMRLFFSVFTDLGDYNNINAQIGYINSTAVSGVFRHVNGYDTPLDQLSSFVSFNTSFKNSNNIKTWFISEVQMGYDPCVCDYFSEFDFQLTGIESQDVSLTGRSISVDLPLQSGGNPTYTDFLNMNSIQTASQDASGALIYKSLDGMLTDYDKELKEYKDRLSDYNSVGNTAMRSLMGLAKAGLNVGLKGLVPESILNNLTSNAVRVIYNTTKNPEDLINYNTEKVWNYDPINETWVLLALTTPSEAYKKDAKKFSQDLSKTLKGGLGSMSDALFTSFYTTPSKPVKPNMPTATFTEMKIAGSITDHDTISIGNLYNPGSYSFGGAFGPSKYPVYNEPLGLFALLNTPEIEAHTNKQDCQTFPIQGTSRIHYNLDNEFLIKLKSPFKYRFNHAVDFDFERTQVYAQIQVKYIIKNNDKKLNIKAHNIKEFHSLEEGNNLVSTYITDWYPIEMFGEHFFKIEAKHDEWEETFFSKPLPEIEIDKITVKLMADMYFQSPGYGGTEKNTTNYFTYLLFDNSMYPPPSYPQHHKFNSPKSSIEKMVPGDLTLDNEVIETTDNFVHKVVGNTIYINAESITIKGNISVAAGYNAVLQAYWNITSESTSHIDKNITLRIKQNFYNFPETREATDEELKAFCTSSTKEYKSNTPTPGVLAQMEKRIQENKYKYTALLDYDFNLYPNPGNRTINVKVSGTTNFLLEILDINGKVLISSYNYSNTGSFDAANLYKGIYFVRITDDNGYSRTKKFVKIE